VSENRDSFVLFILLVKIPCKRILWK